MKVVAKSAIDRPTRVGIVYSTNKVGNSGWQWHVVGPTWAVCEFEWNVPELVNGGGDYIGLMPDEADAPAVEIRSVSAVLA